MAKRPAASSAKSTAGRKAAAAPPAAAKKSAPASAVTLKTLFEELGAAHELPKKQAHAMMADLVSAVTDQLKKGARIRMSGLGTLEVRTRPARMGRNPATGEAIKIKASKKIAFRAAKELKEAV
ncbi:MAG: HU family DNA-binding protein [Nitrospira sp.]|nr:HU family DNA-binding protein [Nitrospira sp.]